MNPTIHRALLAIAAVIITIPGLRLIFDTAGYVAGKDNLALTPDLYSELWATGSIFVAAGLMLLAGATMARLRASATIVGAIAFLPQGIFRLISALTQDGQHDSYLRAGILETIIGVALAAFAAQSFNRSA